jgi:hypothetical protein
MLNENSIKSYFFINLFGFTCSANQILTTKQNSKSAISFLIIVPNCSPKTCCMFLHLKIPSHVSLCKRLQFFSLVLLLPLFTMAQEQTITGQVNDKNNTPLEGVTVVIKGTTRATSTSQEGRFSLVTTKKGTGRKPTITINSNIGVATLAQNEELYDGPGFVAWRSNVQKSRNVSSTKLYIFDNPNSLPAGVTMAQWMDGRTGDPIDIWLDRLGLRPIEIKNYKAGKTIDWYDKMFQKGMRHYHTLSLSGRKDEISYYMSVGYTDNEGVIVGDKFKTLRTRLNLEGKVTKFFTAGINLQFADRDESQVSVNWRQMVNGSPYGEIYTDDGLLLRDSPNDDIGNNSNPFMDNVSGPKLRRLEIRDNL